jgi:hypothetical protein
MTKQVSVAVLKRNIKDNPESIKVLLRTLPYSIEQEEKRENVNMNVIKGLTERLLMVRKLARQNNIPTYGLIG